jgi:hypothetical protein
MLLPIKDMLIHEALTTADGALPVACHCGSWGLDGIITHSPMSIGHVVSLCDEASEACALTPSSEALLKELCDLLVILKAASPGSCKEIACLLTEKSTICKIKRVKEYLKSKTK